MHLAKQITKQQYQLLWHTLGITATSREPYRNHFVTGGGNSELADLEQMVELGAMKRVPTPAFISPDQIVFAVTEEGVREAILALPQVAHKNRSRYDEYLSSEYGNSFADFLGIALPKVNYRNGHYQYSRLKYDQYHQRQEIAGEWFPTKKAAKQSYQKKLSAFNRQLRLARQASERDPR